MNLAILSLHSSPYGDLGTSDTGGMSIYIRETARHMAEAGHRLDIFTRRTRPGQQQIVEIQDRMRLIHVAAGPPEPMPKLKLAGYLDECFTAIDHICKTQPTGYDLIHSHYWLSACVGQRLQAHWAVPHMVTFHTLAAVKDKTGAGEPEPAQRIDSEKRIASQCSRILVATQREKTFTSRLCGVSGDKIEVIGGGVNLALFQPQDKRAARRQLNLPVDDIVVLYAGRFDAMKGIDRLVESMALLNLDHPVRLWLVGGDDENSPARLKLQDLAAGLGCDGSVHFAGRVEHERMPYYYSAADVVTVASHYESFGLVALEALACGTPVVATRVGAMEQVITPNNGYLVDRPSAAELAAGITCCVSASFRQKVSTNTIRASVAGYDWSRTAAGLLETYARLE